MVATNDPLSNFNELLARVQVRLLPFFLMAATFSGKVEM